MTNYEKRMVHQAWTYSNSGRFPEAARILRQINQKYPNDVTILVELGHVSMNNAGDLTNGMAFAEQCFRKAIKIDPEYGRSYKKLGEWYNARGDYQTGVKLCTKALTVKQPDVEGLRERAGAYSNLNRDKEALEDINFYIKKVNLPKTGLFAEKILLHKAGTHENLKQYDKALEVYRGLLSDHYEDSLVFREVACLRAMNKPQEALKSLNNLIARNKADDTGYLNRARLYESLGKHNEAVKDYSVALDLAPSTTALKERAAVYDKIGHKDLAARDRREAERL